MNYPPHRSTSDTFLKLQLVCKYLGSAPYSGNALDEVNYIKITLGTFSVRKIKLVCNNKLESIAENVEAKYFMIRVSVKEHHLIPVQNTLHIIESVLQTP